MKKLVWLDLETTGLTPGQDLVLSIGMRVTDANLAFVAEAEWDARQPQQILDARLSPIVKEMHTRNGLLARCAASPFTWSEVRTLARAFLLQHVGSDQTSGFDSAILAGSSIHFDHRFLAVSAPELLKFFHYRMLDVSVFKVLSEMWNLETSKSKSEAAHTPLRDIYASIETFMRYCNDMLQPGLVPWK